MLFLLDIYKLCTNLKPHIIDEEQKTDTSTGKNKQTGGK